MGVRGCTFATGAFFATGVFFATSAFFGFAASAFFGAFADARFFGAFATIAFFAFAAGAFFGIFFGALPFVRATTFRAAFLAGAALFFGRAATAAPRFFFARPTTALIFRVRALTFFALFAMPGRIRPLRPADPSGDGTTDRASRGGPRRGIVIALAMSVGEMPARKPSTMKKRFLPGALAVSLTGLLSVHCSGESGGEVASSGPETGTGTGATSSASRGGTSADSSTGGSSADTGGGETTEDTGSSSGATIVSGDGGTGGPQSVLQRGNDLFRRATYVEPALATNTVSKMAPDTAFNGNATFPGNGNTENQGTGSVLYLEDGPAAAGCPAGATGCQATTRPAGNGLFFAFPALKSNPNVVAFDETTGHAVWTAHVTTGGDGIRGTPVIDPMSRRLFVVTGNNPHLVHALSVDNGVEVTTGGWPVTLSSKTVSYNGATFNSGGENQHGASLLANGILYIPFGGPYGDGGTYLGWIVAVNITNPAQVAGWATESARSGIWGSGGLASDGTSVFGVTGDTTSVARNASDSQEVVRVTGMASFTRSAANVFVPTEATGWDKPKADLDFGASTPAYVPLPAGSNPSALLVAPAKAGRVFFLDGTNLSAGTYDPTARTAGGSLADVVVSGTDGETVYTSPTIYSSSSGLHATINVGGGGAGCPAATPNSQEMIVSTLIAPGKTPIAKVIWCAPVKAGGGHMNFPPISTTTDGMSANALVWFIEGSQLAAVDGDSGSRLLTTTGAACDNIPSMSFPIAVKNRIVVSALGHLCSWSIGGT